MKELLYGVLKIVGRQDWLRVGLRQKLLRLFVNPDKPPSYEFTADFFGLKFKGNLNCYLDWCVFFFGAYEKRELLLLESVMKQKKGGVFLDIGANSGEYSLLLSRHASKVVAFEPYDRIAEKLRGEISLNGIKNIEVREAALGNAEKEMEFYAPLESSNTGTASLVREHEAAGNRPYKKIKVYNASEYIEGLGLPGVDVIKIDVEGFEKDVLTGLQRVIEKYRPVILMEFSETTRDSFGDIADFFSLLKGYEISEISCGRPVAFFFNSPSVRLEKFELKDAPCNLLLKPV